MKALKNTFTVLTLLLLVSMQCLSTHADDQGGGSTGGGFATAEGELLDFAEAKGSGKVPMEITNYRAAYKIVNEIQEKLKNLKKITATQSQHPISSSFKFSLSNKVWLFSQEELKNTKTKEIHVLLDKKTKKQIAVQNKNKIIVYRPWFEKASALQQAGLIVHEVFMNIAMEYGIDHNNVRELTRALFAEYLGGQSPSSDSLQKIFEQLGFMKVQDRNDNNILLTLKKDLQSFLSFLNTENAFKNVSELKNKDAEIDSHRYIFEVLANNSLQHQYMPAYINMTKCYASHYIKNTPTPNNAIFPTTSSSCKEDPSQIPQTNDYLKMIEDDIKKLNSSTAE